MIYFFFFKKDGWNEHTCQSWTFPFEHITIHWLLPVPTLFFNIKFCVMNHKGNWLGTFLKINFGWTKKNLVERDLNLRPPDWRARALPLPTLLHDIYRKKVVSLYGASPSRLFPPPPQRYWKNRETVNIGLVGSVGRAPARQSGGRRFKSRSSKFFFVHPKIILNIKLV